MSLKTHSIFYYGFEVDDTQLYINFNEGGAELKAELDIGSYTLTEILSEVKTAMDAVGTQTYSVSVDRDTRKVTISSTGNFEIMGATGSNRGATFLTELGFSATDTGLSTSHTGGSAAGSAYEPQFILQDYVDSNQNEELVDGVVNVSASGAVETFGFGSQSFVEMNMKYINDYTGHDGEVIKENTSGRADAVKMLAHLIQKRPVEFMPDIADRSTFEKLILERTPKSSKGIGFSLRELVGQSLPGYYETGRIVFRKI